jgi:GNAT superfamily N-acetyltransferase
VARALADRRPHGRGHASQHRGWRDLHRLGRRPHHTPAATITINRYAKPELWTEQEQAEPALYAHKVTVDRAYGGQGLGAELLDWAGTKAADEGADWLRVDVWTTNERLQHYYLREGFTYVRTVVLAHNPSGALFQRPAKHVPTPHFQEGERLTG